MASSHARAVRLPDPPPFARRFALSPVQWIGAPLLLVLPVLALLGVFGESQGSATASGTEVELRVAWPIRTRHEMIHDIEVVVRNRTARVIDTLTVAIDSAYLSAFTARAFTPAATQPWAVELIAVRPGETRHVVVEIDADAPGRHSGAVTATAGGSDTARVTIATRIFP